MDIQELLMTYEDFLKSSIRPAYVFTIEKGGQQLVYYGSTHSNDPAHPQFEDIKKQWDKFVDETSDKSRIAMTEGGLRKPAQDEPEAIRSGAESGLLTYLATRDGVVITSPEPNREEELQYLLKSYSLDEIEYYYFARNVVQWHRMKDRVNFEEYMEQYFEKRKKQVSDSSNLSVDGMKKIHNELFGGELDESNRDFFHKRSWELHHFYGGGES